MIWLGSFQFKINDLCLMNLAEPELLSDSRYCSFVAVLLLVLWLMETGVWLWEGMVCV
jgi:hypothetical protein